LPRAKLPSIYFSFLFNARCRGTGFSWDANYLALKIAVDLFFPHCSMASAMARDIIFSFSSTAIFHQSW